ncbi:MAG: SDR family NAD(P)-dependent oxidoreductase, partial [Acidimicrobiales bacterium]
MALDIDGASAIVTGGASGLGEATARLLAERGALVVVLDMQDDKGEAVAKDIGGVYARADVADAGQVVAAVEAAVELGPLKALVNCAGIGWAARTIGKDGSFESAHDLGVYRKVIEVNLIGTFN